MSVSFTILGSPQSKANSRRLVKFGNRIASIKSAKALSYVQSFHMQCPKLSSPMEGDLKVTITIFYESRRNDLDDSLLLDAMQNLIYKNDRQVKERHIYWALDKANPRSVILVEPL